VHSWSKRCSIIDKYWAEDAFPFELLPAFKELNMAASVWRVMAAGAARRSCSAHRDGVGPHRRFICTFFGVHDGLAMGSIYLAVRRNRSRSGSPMARFGKD